MAKGVTGVSELRRRLRRLPPDTTAELRKVFKEEAASFQTALQAAAPRDKGRLGAAALAIPSRDELGFAAGYSKKRAGFKRMWKRGGFVALWQEFRTKQAPAQPFIEPTYEARKAGVLQRIERALQQMLQRAGR